MKKKFNLLIAGFAIFFIFTENNKSYSQFDEAKKIILTDKIVLKYINTFPDFVKLAKKINSNFQANQSVDYAFRSNEKITSFLKSKGWTKPEEFYIVHFKIAILVAWIMIQPEGNQIPVETKRQMEQSYAHILKNYTESEKAILKKHSLKIKEMYESLSSE